MAKKTSTTRSKPSTAKKAAQHRLVVIGDSLSQGFMSGAIHRTDLCYPMMIARAMGIDKSFRVPDFKGEGGLPLNLERALHLLGKRYGPGINFFEAVPAMLTLRNALDKTEDYWERGNGSKAYPNGTPNHNLAVWGFEVGDSFTLTEGICRRAIPSPKDNLLKQVPEMAMYRTARRTLNPIFDNRNMELTQIAAARDLARDGGIENLIVWLGANNALGTVTSLEIKPSADADLYTLAHKRRSNLYSPAHFAELFQDLAERIKTIGAQRVFVCTVPHVTIPPVSRGVLFSPGEELWKSPRTDRSYYEYYTRPWIWDEDFDPEIHKEHLTREEAEQIDYFIDEYNAAICAAAQRNGWKVIDTCGMLDKLAFRSSEGKPTYQFPEGLVKAVQQSNELSYLWDKDTETLRIDTRFLQVDDKNKISSGGVFSLDGIHPTTIGYGLIADHLIEEMRDAGVSMDGLDKDGIDKWWNWIVKSDDLLGNPPIMLSNLQKTLHLLDKRNLLSDVLGCFN